MPSCQSFPGYLLSKIIKRKVQSRILESEVLSAVLKITVVE